MRTPIYITAVVSIRLYLETTITHGERQLHIRAFQPSPDGLLFILPSVSKENL